MGGTDSTSFTAPQARVARSTAPSVHEDSIMLETIGGVLLVVASFFIVFAGFGAAIRLILDIVWSVLGRDDRP